MKLLAALAGTGGTGTSCSNSAATITTAIPAAGMVAWGTTLHPRGPSFVTTETAFTPAIISGGEYASIGGRCAAILGNGSGFGILPPC